MEVRCHFRENLIVSFTYFLYKMQMQIFFPLLIYLFKTRFHLKYSGHILYYLLDNVGILLIEKKTEHRLHKKFVQFNNIKMKKNYSTNQSIVTIVEKNTWWKQVEKTHSFLLFGNNDPRKVKFRKKFYAHTNIADYT